jgi:hypothetical protein
MPNESNRSKADRANVFADHSYNGNGADSPGKEKARVVTPGKFQPRDLSSYNGDDQKQAKKRNESERYAKGEFFIAPKAALPDKRLSDLAFRVLCYALSKGGGWRLCVWQLRQVFGKGKQAMTNVMKQIEAAGYARLEFRRGRHGRIIGKQWHIIRKPRSKTGSTDSHKNRPSVKVGIEEGKSIKKEQSPVVTHSSLEKGDNGVSQMFPGCLSLRPKPKCTTRSNVTPAY